MFMLKLSQLKISQIQIRQFYLLGAILMVFSLIGSLWNCIAVWHLLNNFGAKLSQVCGCLFQFLWFGLFFYLYKLTPRQQPRIVESKELDDYLNKLKQEDKK